MITSTRHKRITAETMYYDFRGLSTDTKPTEWGSFAVSNGSTFIEIDTGDLYLYDEENESWEKVE